MAREFDFTVDMENAIKTVDGLSGKVNWIAMNSLNEVAFKLREENAARMDSIFDGGATPWTKRAVVVHKARSESLRVEVAHQPIQARYLALQEEGGVDDRSRSDGQKSPYKLFVPVSKNVEKDAYGNMLPDYIDRTAAENPKEYFIGRPKGWANSGKALWRRTGAYQTASGKTAFHKITPYVLFVKQRQYRKKIYNFKSWAMQRAPALLKPAFENALVNEISRLMRGR